MNTAHTLVVRFDDVTDVDPAERKTHDVTRDIIIQRITTLSPFTGELTLSYTRQADSRLISLHLQKCIIWLNKVALVCVRRNILHAKSNFTSFPPNLFTIWNF